MGIPGQRRNEHTAETETRNHDARSRLRGDRHRDGSHDGIGSPGCECARRETDHVAEANAHSMKADSTVEILGMHSQDTVASSATAVRSVARVREVPNADSKTSGLDS